MADQRTAGKRLIQVVTCEDSGKVIPFQDSCWSWVVCFAGVVSNIIICGFTFSYGILFPALLEEFQQGKADTGELSQISTLLHRQMQNVRFILVSFGLTPAAGMKNLTYPITCDKPRPPVRKRILRTNAVLQTLQGLKGFLLQNNNDT